MYKVIRFNGFKLTTDFIPNTLHCGYYWFHIFSQKQIFIILHHEFGGL